MKFKSVFAVICLVTLLSSCKKDKVGDDCSVTTNNLAATHKLTSLKYKLSAGMPELDYLLFLEDCERDDLIKLKSNGIYSYTDAGTACSPSGSETGTRRVIGNSLQSDGRITCSIRSYDCKDLVYFFDNAVTQGDRLTFTMTKQ